MWLLATECVYLMCSAGRPLSLQAVACPLAVLLLLLRSSSVLQPLVEHTRCLDASSSRYCTCAAPRAPAAAVQQ